MNKDYKLLYNTVTPIILEIATIISSFILPRLMISSYGSSVNGLVSSITQFLSIISFLEMGVGSVVRYNLYKPLAQQDNKRISEVVSAAYKFFRTLALILLCYVAVLLVLYPLKHNNEFDHLYTALLILAMSISSFSQYYFGQVNQLLLTADQRGYISYISQIVTIILNTIACYVLIKCQASIHLVKLTTSIIFLARPIYLEIYVRKHYNINKKIHYSGEPIKQKWNGVAQHVSAVVLDSTDIIVLTLLSTLSNVSIYYVYHMVVNGMKKIITSATSGIQAKLGNIIAKGDNENLRKTFDYTEWIIHSVSTFLFGCTTCLIVPFVMIYVRGVTDANYNVPLFGIVLTLAFLGHSLRLPYNMLILASGHYKETQKCYVIAAALNLIISIILVYYLGLIGVAIGTFVAMFYQTVWMSYYSYKNIIFKNILGFWKQMIIDAIVVAVLVLIYLYIQPSPLNYFEFALYGLCFSFISIFTIFLMNIIVNRSMFFTLMKHLIKKQ